MRRSDRVLCEQVEAARKAGHQHLWVTRREAWKLTEEAVMLHFLATGKALPPDGKISHYCGLKIGILNG